MTERAIPAAAEIIRQAFTLARNGEFARAEALCGEILIERPEQADALLLRAVIEVQTGRAADGAASIRRFIRTDPSRAAAHALLGDALSALDEPMPALESYDAALRLDRGLTTAHFGRGNVLLTLHRPHDALVSYDQVLAARPGDAETHCKRGNALFSLDQFDSAVECYHRAIQLRPSYADAFNNLGAALMSLNRATPALSNFDAALAIDAGFVEAMHNRGRALRALGRLEESLQSFNHALRLRPDYADALCGRGDVLLDLNCPGDSLAAHAAAARLAPDKADIHNSLGNSLRALKRHTEALVCYDEAIRLDPADAAAHYNRGTALWQTGLGIEETVLSYTRALELNARFPYLPGSLVQAQRDLADWNVRLRAASIDGIVQSVRDGKSTVVPFHFLSVSDSAAAQLSCARQYAAHRFAAGAPAHAIDAHPPGDRVRVAYVSPDFREHAVSYLMAGVFERHDARRFEMVAISLAPEDASPFGQRIKKAFPTFIDASTRRDDDVAALMRELRIDIAVDLTGFTDGSRPGIFQCRAAPVQVNYLGFPGTMGAPFMDYLIADSYVIPAECQSHYSERVVTLPHCFQANDDRRVISDREMGRADAGLPEEGFVFCCFNNSCKITPMMFDVWMRLLQGVPGSVLWLVARHEAVRNNLRREAAGRGVDPTRLVFAARASYSEHLGRLGLADLFLDTLPFGAGTTASDALWSGLPLLTCSGEAFASRMAGSLLRTIGAPELIAFDLEQYENRALDLACHRNELGAIRRRLAENRMTAPLFDTESFTRHLESAYEEMHGRRLRGEDPASFAVPEALQSSGGK